MNLYQKLVLAAGAICLVLALAFPPMHFVTERNPDYNPNSKGGIFGSRTPYTKVKRVDTTQQAFRFAVIIGITGAGFFIAAPRRRSEEMKSKEG